MDTKNESEFERAERLRQEWRMWWHMKHNSESKLENMTLGESVWGPGGSYEGEE
jgi:hypothetical protein